MKKCYKIPAHTRKGRPVASHIRCRKSNNKTDNDSLTGEFEGRKLFFSNTEKIINKLKSEGYFIDLNQSETTFGNSEYIYAYKNSEDFGSDYFAKIRISDHSVSNYDRIWNEIHVGHKPMDNFDYVIKETRFKIDREKYFEIKKFIEETTNYGIETPVPLPTDVITDTWVSKKGRTIYKVTRKYTNELDAYFYKPTGKHYISIK